jgi:hypothetical protein
MTDHGAELVRADLVVRAAAVRTLGPGRRPQRALAVRGDRIAARLLGEEDLRGSLAPAGWPTSPSGTVTPRPAHRTNSAT